MEKKYIEKKKLTYEWILIKIKVNFKVEWIMQSFNLKLAKQIHINIIKPYQRKVSPNSQY